MRKSFLKKLIILLVVLGIIVGGGWITAIVYKNRRKDTNPVKVYSVSYWKGNWYDSDQSLNGNIVLSDEQKVYPDFQREIKDVYVNQGDEVKVGDVLMEYDTTKESLRLESSKAQLGVQEADLRIAQNQLKKLKNVTPIPDGAEAPKSELELKLEESNKALDAAFEACIAPDSDLAVANSQVEELASVVADENKNLEAAKKNYDDAVALYEGGTVFPGNPGKEAVPAVPDDPETPDVDESKPAVDAVPADEEYIKAKTEYETTVKLAKDNYEKAEKRFNDAKAEMDAAVEIQLKCQEESDKAHQAYSALQAENDELMKQYADEIAKKQENPEPIYTESELKKAIRYKTEEITNLSLQIENQKLNIKRQEKNIESSKILCEQNGRVQQCDFSEENLRSGNSVITVSASGIYSAVVQVDEFSLDKLGIGASVTIMSYDTGNYYLGTVSKVADTPIDDYYGYSDVETSWYPVTIVIEGGEDLSEGMYVTVTADMNGKSSEDKMNEIVLPLSMCKKENGSYYVMKSVNGRLEKQFIKTGKIYWGSQIVVKSGLSDDDKIAFPYEKDAVEGKVTVDAEINELYGY